MVMKNCLKIRKTSSKERATYKYYDAYGNLVSELRVGQDGITEVTIKELHASDDREVYNNLKNVRPNRSSKEKELKKNWKEKYIASFEEEHGYKPNPKDVEDLANDVFPRNYSLSLDFDSEGELNQDKGIIALETSTNDLSEFDWSERMETVLERLTEKQRLVIELKYMEGYKQSEIAKIMGVSSAAVKKHLDKAKAVILEHY